MCYTKCSAEAEVCASRSEGDGAAEDDDVLVWDTERHREEQPEPGTRINRDLELGASSGSRSNTIQGALSMPSLGGLVA